MRINEHLPFTTISATVGIFEYLNSNVTLLVIGAIVFVLVSILRAPPKRTSAGT